MFNPLYLKLIQHNCVCLHKMDHKELRFPLNQDKKSQSAKLANSTKKAC